MGRGHTGGDLIAFLPESKIIFMGDLLFNERHPFMGDGDPETWIQHLNLVDKKLHPMIAVPGHGPIGDRTSILIFRQYIQTISTLIDQAIDDNTSNEDLSSIAVPAAYTSWLLSRFYPINLQILVQQRKNSPKKN